MFPETDMPIFGQYDQVSSKGLAYEFLQFSILNEFSEVQLPPWSDQYLQTDGNIKDINVSKIWVVGRS